MRVLQLYSNWKWTGPAEHALALVSYLARRGYDLAFACGYPPNAADDSLKRRAEWVGVRVEPHFHLRKHFTPWRNVVDVVRLASYLSQHPVDLIHTHLLNDHLIAGMARALSARKVPIVRTVYDGEGLQGTLRNKLLLSRFTDGIVAISQRSKRAIEEKFTCLVGRVWHIPPGVDCDRFNPMIKGDSIRKSYGVQEHDMLVGIVARVQPHRRFEVFLQAIAEVVKVIPELKVFIIGRGTHIQEVAVKPVEVMGLSKQVIFTGYRMEDYPRFLAALDIKVFLVPGSDGSCRAVKEAMATGKPVIVARRGALPEIVEHGVSGLVIEDTREELAEALFTLCRDVSLRKKMGEAARVRAVQCFAMERRLAEVEEVYRWVVGKRMGSGE